MFNMFSCYFSSFFWLLGFAFLFNWFVFYIQRQFLSMEGQCEIRDKAVKYHIYIYVYILYVARV